MKEKEIYRCIIGCDKNMFNEKWGYSYDEDFDYKKQFRIGWFYICWGLD